MHLLSHFGGVTFNYGSSKVLEMKHKYGWLYCRPEQGTVTARYLWEVAEELSKKGDVIYESAFLRAGNGYIEKASKYLGNDMIFAFLNTPVDVCIQRVVQRQLASGRKHGEVKPDNIARGDREIRRALDVLRKAGRQVVEVSWEHPLESLLGVLYYRHLCKKGIKPCEQGHST
jgi:hypothetical protein